MEPITTRIVTQGDTQTIKIPAEPRLDTEHVSIARNSDGDLIIHSLPRGRGAALLEALNTIHRVDAAYVAALEAGLTAPQKTQEREPL